jgi:hypothetical protein
MKQLRQRLGLEEDDTSRDDYLATLSLNEVFEEICNWNGLINYAYTIRSWIEDIYGISVE